MPGEKQNDIKERIGAMNAIPQGYRFDRERSWQKLEPQLIAVAGRTKGFLWSVAAAVVLFVSGIIYFTPSGKNDHIPEAQPLSGNNRPSKKIISIEKSLMHEKPDRSIVEVHARKALHSIKRTLIQADTLKLELPQTEAMALDQQEQKKRRDTAEAKLATLQKPKYKVAHINELYGDGANMVQPPPRESKTALFKRKFQPLAEDEPLNNEEKRVIPPKKKLFSALIISSQ